MEDEVRLSDPFVCIDTAPRIERPAAVMGGDSNRCPRSSRVLPSGPGSNGDRCAHGLSSAQDYRVGRLSLARHTIGWIRS